MLLRRKAIPARRTHLHRCGDYDACYRDNPLETDCKQCEREAFNRRRDEEAVAQADPINRHPEGAVDAGDVTPTHEEDQS